MDESVISKKKVAAQALNSINGVGGIGLAWTQSGQQVVQVDLEPGSNRNLVERRLSELSVPFVIRNVSGFVRSR